MPQELAASANQLHFAVDRHVRACCSVRDACLGGGRLNNSLELFQLLEKESDDIAAHIRKLEDARAAVHAARSSFSKIAPITNLPAEILAHIFSLVVPGQLCLVQRDEVGRISKIKYPLYPDALAHICSFWRRVAIGTPSLWTHIDIALDHPLNPGLVYRARVYAARAGQLPLDIHISDPGSERERTRGRAIQAQGRGINSDPSHGITHEWDDLHEFKILTSKIVPIKSLQLDLYAHSRYREVYYSVLEYFFASSKLGVFTKYVVRGAGNGWTEPNPFIEPADTPHTLDGALLAVPSDHLEALWLQTSIIRVSDLCPHWKSKAYHGLVELYIDPGIPELSESQLVNVLRSSPKLQVFHLRAVVEEDINDANIQPVYLEDLRDLCLMVWFDENLSVLSVLQWIAPGTKPLQFAYMGSSNEMLVQLFARANVTRYYNSRTYHSLAPVLSRSSRLETVVLDGVEFDIKDLTSLLDNNDYDTDGSDQGTEITLHPVTPSTTRIDTLYLLRITQFSFEEAQAVVRKYSVRRLVIYGGKLSYQTGEGRVICENTRNIKTKLSSITDCPVIEYYPDSKLIARNCDDWIITSMISSNP